MTEITDHLAQIFERVARAAQRARRSPSSVTIVAIGKQQPASAIAEAQRAGVAHFGESYVQEALPKIAALADVPITWHFVGKMQANKTRQVAETFDWVHTVDRLKIAERLSEQRSPFAKPLNVFIQVNQGSEPQKSGARADDVAELARAIGALPRLALRGLMTLPPQSGTAARWFAELATLRARLENDGIALDSLSMGMSGDFEDAIAAGATHVRIGTAIFGSRGA
ncbi:MAG TPA: YggS family pyridoxal phosphate-dependent enzyme [Gammaproteobacteria bacterium]|nr:YggS family pyridoxal phosphate-dependent enzyme [Gammaproteobacteria bacterium]